MKYCLRCGHIIADNSLFKDDSICCGCKILLEEDNMTSEQFNTLSERQKEEYTQSLYNKIKNSDVFDKSLCEYGTPDFYSSYWFDKYENLTGDVADRYGDDLKQHMQARYGKNSPAYQKAVVEQYIQSNEEIKGQVKCVFCNSANVYRISITSKIANTALLGIFGQKRKHQWHCNDCNSDF